MTNAVKTILYGDRFLRSFEWLSREIQIKAVEREKIFKNDIFDPRLDTHKLHGNLKRIWAFSVTNKYRIFFAFTKTGILFLDIDDHDFYQ